MIRQSFSRWTTTSARYIKKSSSNQSIRSFNLFANNSILRPLNCSKSLNYKTCNTALIYHFSSSTKDFEDKDDFEEDEDDDEYKYDLSIQYPTPLAKIGEFAPVFDAPAVIDGEIKSLNLKEYRGKYVVLFFYPKDFTFVCPTEIIAFSDRVKEFEKINTKIIAISTDTENSHLAWTRLPRNQGGLGKLQIPLVADTTKIIANKYGVLNETLGIAYRGLFIINPEGKLEQITMNNFPVGRSVDETLRLVQAFQFVAENGEVCPANWTPGSSTIIPDPEDSQHYFSTVKDDIQNSSEVIDIKSVEEFNKIVSSGKSVVVDFMANWCGKCQQILPYFEELAEKKKNSIFLKVDTTIPELDKLKEAHNVSVLPTFICFKNGKSFGNPVSGYKKRHLSDAVNGL